ncbi:hypothetical protein ACQ7CX_19715 [Chryseobacterium arthrosphaerae]|uniref:hypothetical protein n=1 Tax=Chryseobacterium arthrosphaerae TaxID=651561 RepID=UPI001BAF1AB8|nr:hypothetical protein [Chryseobacterium arthrosphaerae]QUY56015.1 hypothetical protein I2F65_01205 [Chryseobacterium arthrosphaerae]
MKANNITLTLLSIILFSLDGNAQPNDRKVIIYDQTIQNNFNLINTIDQTAIGKKIEDQNTIQHLKRILSQSFNREIERPYMWDIFTSSNDTLLQFHQYKDFTIDNTVFKSYYINVNYEDAKYQGILLVNETTNNIYNSMIVYEQLISEEKYQRTSEVKGDKIYLQFMQGKSSKNLAFLIKNGLFLDYLDTTFIDKQWGNKEMIHSNTVYEYQLKGKTNNHLKNGYWIEKRYSTDYRKSVIEDGNYINGIKDGEWNYSPEGPVDKIEVYKDGKVMKTYSP